MSTAQPHDPAVAAHGADAHSFDGEPARALPADEPPTPIWVPVLGLVLFVTAGTAFLADSASDAPPQAAAAKASAEAPPRPVPKPPAQRPDAPSPAGVQQLIQRGAPGGAAPGVAAPGVAAPGGAAPGAVPSANLRKLTPEEVDAMRKRILDTRSKAGAQPQPVQPAPAPPK